MADLGIIFLRRKHTIHWYQSLFTIITGSMPFRYFWATLYNVTKWNRDRRWTVSLCAADSCITNVSLVPTCILLLTGVPFVRWRTSSRVMRWNSSPSMSGEHYPKKAENTVDSQFIAPPVTSLERPISALHGAKKSTSPNPGYCITVWFCVDLDITAYQTACAHSKRAPWYALLCAMHPHSNDQNVRVARTMCTLCLAAICQHWWETCGKCNGIYWSMSTLSGKIGPFHLARWWRYELWIQRILI